MKVYAHWDGDPQFTLIAVVADRAAATSAGGTSCVRTAAELIARFASAFNAKHPSHAPLSPSLLSLHKSRGQVVGGSTALSKAVQDLDDLFPAPPASAIPSAPAKHLSSSSRVPSVAPVTPVPSASAATTQRTTAASLAQVRLCTRLSAVPFTLLSLLHLCLTSHPLHMPAAPPHPRLPLLQAPVPPHSRTTSEPSLHPCLIFSCSLPFSTLRTSPLSLPVAPRAAAGAPCSTAAAAGAEEGPVPGTMAAGVWGTEGMGGWHLEGGVRGARGNRRPPACAMLLCHACSLVHFPGHAMLLANELLAVAPNLKLAYRALAAMHMAISRHDRALPVLQAAVAAHPADPLLHLRLAQATLHVQQPTEALPLADRALSLATKQGWPQQSKRRGAGKGGRGGGMVGVLGSKQSAAQMMRRARVSGQQAAEMFGLPENEEEEDDDDEEGDGGKGGKGGGRKGGGAGGAWDVDSPYAGDPHGDVSLDDIKVECGRALLQAGAVDVAAAVVAGVLQGDEHHEGALLLYGDVLLQQRKAQAGTHTPQGNSTERPEGSGAEREVRGETEGGRMHEEEEAMKAYLRVLLAHPQQSTARAKIAHVLQHHASARRLLLSQLRAGAGAPADTARALVFFASACKDHSALDAACEFMQVAVALAPGSSSHVLALLHLHEVMLNGCAALHLARSFCEARPGFRLGPITLGSVLPFLLGLPIHPGSCEDASPCPHERGVQLEFLRRWDGGGAQEGGGDELGAGSARVASRGAERNGADSKGDSGGGGEGGEVAGVGMGKEEYNPEQLDILALLMTTVKALFLGGAVQRAKAVGALVERARLASATPLHQTLIRNEAAYFGCAFQLLTQYPIPHSLSDNAPEPLFLAGDSHCMAAAWRVVQLRGRPRLLCPVLITGLKAWHLRPESTFFPKASFHRAMQRVPKGSEVVVLFGEIDCREGILISVDRTKYKDVEEGVQVTVDIYIAVLLALIAARAFEIFVHPVPSVILETRPLARIYNATLRRRCLAAAATAAAGGRLHMLDFFNGLLTDDQESLRREFEFDGTHMSPLYPFGPHTYHHTYVAQQQCLAKQQSARRLAAKVARGEVVAEEGEGGGAADGGDEEEEEEEEEEEKEGGGGEEGREGEEVDGKEEAGFERQNERLLSLGRTPAAAPVVLHYDSGSLETFVTVTTDFGTHEDEGRAASEEEEEGEEEGGAVRNGLGRVGGVKAHGHSEGGGGKKGGGERKSTALQIAKGSCRKKGKSGGRQQIRRRKKSGEKGKDLKRKKRHGK
ncbi:unnamed protein product [Closterium sp. Naga37s-1]|nr:unnamed protein product [Closterium sp. Naga37s-1]